MENKEFEEKPSEGRRNFLQAGGMALLGLAMPEAMSAKPRATESLAVSGGRKRFTSLPINLRPSPAGRATGRQKRMLFTG